MQKRSVWGRLGAASIPFRRPSASRPAATTSPRSTAPSFDPVPSFSRVATGAVLSNSLTAIVRHVVRRDSSGWDPSGIGHVSRCPHPSGRVRFEPDHTDTMVIEYCTACATVLDRYSGRSLMRVLGIEVQHRTDDGQHRKIVFAPDPEHGGWTRRELHRDASETRGRLSALNQLPTSWSPIQALTFPTLSPAQGCPLRGRQMGTVAGGSGTLTADGGSWAAGNGCQPPRLACK